MLTSQQFVPRDVRQIADSTGNPYGAHVTDSVWVSEQKDYKSFARLTTGNAATPLTTGEEYYKELFKTINAAKQEVLIAGWQINWDALLAPNTRLFDVLLANAKRGVKFYIMPWDDSAPVQTYDDQTKAVLDAINREIGKIQVYTLLAPANADQANAFFSHHQKQVVVDRKYAFVGGIDLAYGRYDDATFNLDINACKTKRIALNRYNSCIPPVGTITPASSVCDPDLLIGVVDELSGNRLATWNTVKAGAYQAPYDEDSPANPVPPSANYKTLDPALQPRMPWQDVHCKIEGPAVSDLTLNFVLRWNANVDRLTSPDFPEVMEGYRLPLPEPPDAYAKTGSCAIQVLRSAPKALRQAEYATLSQNEKKRFAKPDTAQSDILQAMLGLIAKAQHFIYIENQFFQSAFGEEAIFPLSGPAKTMQEDVKYSAPLTRAMPGDSTAHPKNTIGHALADRIGIAILDKGNPPFHVILTLPVHPEGKLNDPATMTQIHWTMQSLVFGSQSLLNRVRRYIKARELAESTGASLTEIIKTVVNDPRDRRYTTVPVEKCFSYITLLNLRNWAKLGDTYVTEQIYVHSKLMIVDDLYALLGSANINDRSLLGSRDSELAVLIIDDDQSTSDIAGNGKPQPVRAFAQNLRKQVWSKLFGITGDIRPSEALRSAVNTPAAAATWKTLQETAKNNSVKYESVFSTIPRNWHSPRSNAAATIWPTWDPDTEELASPMPYDSSYWIFPASRQGTILTETIGFISALPIHWTEGESNNVGYHTALVTQNEHAPRIPNDTLATARTHLPDTPA